MTKKNEFASDALYNTIGNIVYFFCIWLITVLVVRISGYDDAGILSVAMTTSNVFFVVANYGMRSFQASDVVREFSDQQYILSRYITTFLGVLLCVIFAIISGYEIKYIMAIVWFMLFKALEAFADVLYGVLQREHCLKNAGISLCIKGILSVVVFVMVLFVTKNLSSAIAGMFFTSLFILCFYDIKKTNQYIKGAFLIKKTDVIKSLELLKQCFFMFIVSLIPMIFQAIPKLQFERIYTAEELGVYSSIASPTIIIPTFVSCVMIPFLPLFATYIQTGNVKKLLNLFLAFLGGVTLIGVAACTCAYFLGEWALMLLYGDGVRGYTELLILIIVSVSLTCVLYCFNSLYISGRKLSLLATVYIVALGICYLISRYYISQYGIYGIAHTLNVSQGVQCLILLVFSISFFVPKKKY